MNIKMSVKKGDTVTILKGKDTGKSGKVLRVFPKENKVLIDGLNLFKKHKRPTKQGQKGEMVSLPRPINRSNVKVK
ncbi:MAG: 50S ribosomal protein L24 [bacterium]|nr:50S ribosomal protein L24 [bacterium]